MSRRTIEHLSRRERQIMDIVYRLGTALVSEVLKAIPDPPSYSTVRALLGVLVEKGHLNYVRRGRAYSYMPILSPAKARQSALKHALRTFFNGSVEGVVVTLLDVAAGRLTDDELDRLERIIREKRGEERKR
ncbi:MAG: BlaI/MecI/CopY family transcriptional regulator [candidate division Zixibacteria bacterium]|nr:BlaI/MecI/CopY family transcriptional regulator [candidate division Zixibacteria bacterium]